MNNYHAPKEIVSCSCEAGVTKSQLTTTNMVALGILAGVYIAFAAEGSTMAIHDMTSVGLSRFLCGAIFAIGLMMVVICGAELFTGNVLMWIGVLERKITAASMLRNWFWVYLGNFIGSVLLAYLMDFSGLWLYDNGLNGAAALKIAAAKMSLSFGEAFARGILCNWLVCLAVWMGMAAKDITGKIWGIFFPIALFITSNFEHSVANMYYLSAALLAKANPALVEAAHLGNKIDIITFQAMFANLVPVTLGNIVGGAFFVGGYYWFCYLRQPQPVFSPAKNTKSDPA